MNWTMFGALASALAIALALLPYEAPKGKRVSTLFYLLAWCAVAGTLLAYIAESDAASLGGYLFIAIGYGGTLLYVIKKGSIYVDRQ